VGTGYSLPKDSPLPQQVTCPVVAILQVLILADMLEYVVGVGEGTGVAVGVLVGLALAELVGVETGVLVGLGAGVTVGDGLGVAVGVTVGFTMGEGEAVGDGFSDGIVKPSNGSLHPIRNIVTAVSANTYFIGFPPVRKTVTTN